MGFGRASFHRTERRLSASDQRGRGLRLVLALLGPSSAPERIVLLPRAECAACHGTVFFDRFCRETRAAIGLI
jgi:hypothetical protein